MSQTFAEAAARSAPADKTHSEKTHSAAASRRASTDGMPALVAGPLRAALAASAAAQRWSRHGADVLRVYVNRYPPIALYLVVLAALAAPAVTACAAFVAMGTAWIVGSALAGAVVAEVTLVLWAAAVLFAVLGGVALGTTVAFVSGGAMYAIVRGTLSLVVGVYERVVRSEKQHDS